MFNAVYIDYIHEAIKTETRKTRNDKYIEVNY